MDQHTEGTMDTREIIKGKLRECFDGKIVRKDLTKKIKKGPMYPSMSLSSSWGSIVAPMMKKSSKRASRT